MATAAKRISNVETPITIPVAACVVGSAFG